MAVPAAQASEILREEMRGAFHHDGMTAGKTIVVFVVTATDHSGNRGMSLQAVSQHAFIPFAHTVEADVEVAEFIALPDIGAGIVQHQIRLLFIEQLQQGCFHHAEIGVIGQPCVQTDIQIAGGFAEGEVFLAVNGTGKSPWLIGQNRGTAIPLMHIQIEDQHLVDFARTEQGQRGVRAVEVIQNSLAWRAGLRQGDLIISVNKQPIYSLKDVERAVDEDDAMLLLNVVRGNSGLFIVIR